MGEVTALQVEAVRQMLAAQWRHVQIAREMNLSLWTISKIARDLREQDEIPIEEETFEDDAPPGFEAKNLRRCSECGATVYLWPCLACRIAMNTMPLVDEVIEEDEEEEELRDLFGVEEAA